METFVDLCLLFEGKASTAYNIQEMPGLPIHCLCPWIGLQLNNFQEIFSHFLKRNIDFYILNIKAI